MMLISLTIKISNTSTYRITVYFILILSTVDEVYKYSVHLIKMSNL